MVLRHKIFVLTAILTGLLFTLRIALLSGPAGEPYRLEAERIAKYTGELGAIRGRIYDRSGELAAWSERCYDLSYRPNYGKSERFNEVKAALKSAFPQSKELQYPRRKSVVKTNLTASELEIADELCSKYPQLHIDLRWERRVASFQEEIGEVRQINGIERGISGLEKQYDRHLRGTPGKFEVMLDRHGRWINSTFRIVQAAQNGADIDLSELKEAIHAPAP